jgi:predicted nucleic acid-binding protein
MTGILIDTNVLVYAYDRGEFEKQEQAKGVLEYLHLQGTGRLSAQTLAEFFRAATRGRQPILSVEQAQRQAEFLAQAWTVLDITPQIVLEAVRGVRAHQLSYWDAHIWAAAKLNQIPVVLSEDIPYAGALEGVRFVNPFARDFDIENWA